MEHRPTLVIDLADTGPSPKQELDGLFLPGRRCKVERRPPVDARYVDARPVGAVEESRQGAVHMANPTPPN